MLQKVWARRLILAVMDVCFVLLSLFIGAVLRYALEEAVPGGIFRQLQKPAPWIALIYLALYALGGVYGILWRSADVEELLRLLFLCVLGFALTAIANQVFDWRVPLSVLALTAALTGIATTMSRMFWRALRGGRIKWRYQRTEGNVMIVGAGEAGAYVIDRYLRGENRRTAAQIILVDDDPLKRGRRVHGVIVRGGSDDIERLVADFEVKGIIIAIPSLAGQAYTDLVARCNATKTHVRILSDVDHGPSRYRSGGPPSLQLRELNISDFLSREQIVLDIVSIKDYLQGQVVLVSGGGGSIGSEICRQVMRFEPKQLLILDIYENGAYTLLAELKRLYGMDCPAKILIGSIREKDRLQEIFSLYRPQVVFHAAAHKHVSLMEECPGEAVKNNVFGTMNMLDVASSYGVKRFVQLSTDKAVNPSCVMGATKRIAEMLNQLYAERTKMKCMVVRFGNVLGSHGSVIPLFEAQIKAGGPVTVTDPDVTRYFMTIPEAAQLVLQAGGLAESGATYVLQMGEPVKILDLAKRLIRFYGYEPGRDMKIIFTGLQEGEKMHEELMTEKEWQNLRHTAHNKIMISPPIDIDEASFQEQLEALRAVSSRNDQGAYAALERIVTPAAAL